MPTFTRGGAAISYSDTGIPAAVPDAPTIVFGHGLLFSGWMFHPQIQALSDRYRCVTIDWRGQGETPPAAGGYDMEALTADAVDLIEQVSDQRPVHWVGLSMGGFVGQRLAARYPDLVRSLTLLSTSAERDADEVNSGSTVLAETIRSQGTMPDRGTLLSIMFGPNFTDQEDHQKILDQWVENLTRSKPEGIADAILGVVHRTAVTGELGRIVAPTLVLRGEHDAVPLEAAQAIANSVDDGQFVIVPDAGHACTLEQPDFVTKTLSTFVDQH